MKLEGKVVLVTGGGSGIGRAITHLFIQEGARVVSTDLHANTLETLAGELKEADRASLTTFTGDVSVRADAEKMVDLAVSTYGTLDVVVNNAGIMDNFTPLSEVDDALWEKVLAVNLDGPMYICRRALETMLPRKQGVIVNVSSVGGLFGGRAGASYTVSKHALIGLTRSIAYHYALSGIRCNAICPGGVSTNISIDHPSALGFERVKTTIPMSIRMGESEELARAALFLASDDSSFVNGDIMVVDGGMTAG